jgi:hypothetical protein
VRVLGPFDRDGDDLVLLEDLDGALRAPGAVGDEEDGVATLARLTDVGDPVADTAAELEGGLAKDAVEAESIRT